MLFTHLHYRRFDKGPPRLIDGKTLLFLLQRCMDRERYGTIRGNGSQQNPWRLDTAAAWLACSRNLTSNYPNDAYLTLGGRMLKKNARVYISDEGPVWRHLQGRGQETPQSSKAYAGAAPTYQMAAQRIVRPHEVFPRSANEGVRAAGWNDVAHTPMLVHTMRHLLKQEPIPLLQDGRVSKHYSRLQHSLPVLTAAMFLAEPARNLRAFPINLMLLDLAERGIAIKQQENSFFTMDRILWHPDALDINQNISSPESENAPTQSVMGPVGQNRKIQQVDRRSKLHLVGGEMPASPTRGGEIGGSRQFKIGEPGDFSRVPENRRESARQSWLRGQLRIQNYDFIFQKEVSVLVRWIAMNRPYTFAAVQGNHFSEQTVEVPNWNVLFYEGFDRETVDLRDIEVLFWMRLNTLNRI